MLVGAGFTVVVQHSRRQHGDELAPVRGKAAAAALLLCSLRIVAHRSYNRVDSLQYKFAGRYSLDYT